MKKFISQIFIIFLLGFTVFSQGEDAKLIDEFSFFNSEILEANLKLFYQELKSKPDMKGYIITHRGKEQPLGSPIRFLTTIESFLTLYKLPRNKFELINGEPEAKLRVQFWIIPSSNKNPFQESAEKINLTKTFLFDSFYNPSEDDVGGCCIVDNFGEQEKEASIAAYIKILRENPNLKAYVIYYGRHCTDCSQSAVYSKDGEYLGLKPNVYLDTKEEISKIMKKERKNFIKKYRISKDRITIVNGGFKRWRQIELWFVPKGGEIPKPTPETYPKK